MEEERIWTACDKKRSIANGSDCSRVLEFPKIRTVYSLPRAIMAIAITHKSFFFHLKNNWVEVSMNWIKLDRTGLYCAHLQAISKNYRPLARLRVVAHFSSGIVERAKRERMWKSPHSRKGDTRWEERNMRVNTEHFYSVLYSMERKSTKRRLIRP